MNEWELTDEEIQHCIKDGAMRHAALGTPAMRQAIDHSIATAAQRKLVEWLNKHCFVYEGPCGKCGEDVYDDSVCCFRATDMAALGVK